ncbi:unnamed protein product [Lactuca virosa]|uniref:Formin-like protein n=1 Tax=Lactuca virosa TaxID=75947 RepID=A0AAU9LL44_9ASTR|nr:unnamed protein product [Lactuca virosa]
MNHFTRLEEFKGVIVDEEGLDVFYWRNLDDDEPKRTIFKKEHPKEEEKKMISVDHGRRKSNTQIQEIPLLTGKSSASLPPANQQILKSQLSSRSPPPTPPTSPPPPLLVLPPPPPPKPKTGGLTLTSSTRPSQVKLKPLHCDKVNTNVEHPTAWDKLGHGSFRFNGDLMGALFGTIAANKKSPRGDPTTSPTPKPEKKSGPPSQVFILDTRKSQNIAIILRSLTVSRREIIDCLFEGKGIDINTLEKLTRITPTKEEEQLILNYDHDITRLADAESFLYHILRTVPSAFTRFNAMFFKLNYDSKVSHIKNTLQILEKACNELRNCGLFVKLLEAILKAGNQMNAGTSRGNAQAVNLNSLLKLSNVKSSDGRTSLLHFVVEEVVRLEGKRCMINRNHSLRYSTVSLNCDTSSGKDYIRLGLPIVGGVSSEFYNVKKAAGIEYDALSKSSSGLNDRLTEIMKTVEECGGGGGDGGRGFVREMEKFVERAEREIHELGEEEERVIRVVNKTNEYYQVGASKDKGRKQFQLFGIVKAFLEMVDKACVDIAVKLQKRRTGGGEAASAAAVVVPPMPTTPNWPSVKFPVLPVNFISSSSSSDSDEDL